MKLSVLLLLFIHFSVLSTADDTLISNTLLIEQEQLINDFKYLSSDALTGRKPETSGHALAQKYITQQYHHLSLLKFNHDYHQEFDYQHVRENKKGVNLVGYLPGSKYSNMYWIITAHYDHLGHKGEKIFNGADDNASGVAALLQLIRYFHENPPQYSIIFVATDAEEDGLKGAKAFLSNPPVPLSSLILNINLDMLSQDANWKTLYVAGTRQNTNLKYVVESVKNELQTSSFKLKRGHDRISSRGINHRSANIDWKKASDHSEFRKNNIPYLFFGVDTHKDYHTVNDVFERTNLLFYKQAVNAVIVSLNYINLLTPMQIKPAIK